MLSIHPHRRPDKRGPPPPPGSLSVWELSTGTHTEDFLKFIQNTKIHIISNMIYNSEGKKIPPQATLRRAKTKFWDVELSGVAFTKCHTAAVSCSPYKVSSAGAGFLSVVYFDHFQVLQAPESNRLTAMTSSRTWRTQLLGLRLNLVLLT